MGEIQFEQQFCARLRAALLFNWPCVDIFGLLTRDREKFFVSVFSSRPDYEGSCL